MRVETYRCDECKTQKDDMTGWWVVQIAPAAQGGHLMLHPWTAEIADTTPTQGWQLLHFCSPKCVRNRIEEFMGEAKSE